MLAILLSSAALAASIDGGVQVAAFQSGFEFVEDASDLRINEAYAGSIAVFQVPSISGIFQSHLRMMAILLHQLKTRMIGRRFRFNTPMSLRNILRIVEIEILFRCPERQVRFRKADRKKERLVTQSPKGLDDGVGHSTILVCGIG